MTRTHAPAIPHRWRRTQKDGGRDGAGRDADRRAALRPQRRGAPATAASERRAGRRVDDGYPRSCSGDDRTGARRRLDARRPEVADGLDQRAVRPAREGDRRRLDPPRRQGSRDDRRSHDDVDARRVGPQHGRAHVAPRRHRRDGRRARVRERPTRHAVEPRAPRGRGPAPEPRRPRRPALQKANGGASWPRRSTRTACART